MRSFLILLLLGTGCEACEDFFDGGKDEPPGDLSGKFGDGCTRPTDCRPGLTCVADNTCGAEGTGAEGEPCELTAQCGEGLYCAPSRTCEAAGAGAEGSDCVATADCAPELVCVIEGFGGRCRSAGEGDLDEPCARTTDCLAGLECVHSPVTGATTCVSPPAVSGDAGAATPSLPYWPGERCEEDTGTPRAYFEIPRADVTRDFYQLPYPNDVRRSADGLDLSGHPTPGTAVAVDVVDRYLRASEADLRGFSVSPVVYFRFSHPYAWDSVGGQLRIVDITPGSPDYGRELPLAWLTTGGPISKYICPNWLALRTPHGSPLRPGTTYAAILGTGIRPNPDVGTTFARAADLDAMLAGASPADAPLAAAWAAYAPLRAWIADASEDASAILNAAVFTTQEPEALVPDLREVIRANALPAISELTACTARVTSPCDDGTAERSCVTESDAVWELHGRMALPIFQEGTAPYETPEDGGGISRDGLGRPIVARTEEVCFSLAVPRAAPPPEGYPLLVHLHGTGGSFTGAIRSGLATEAATASGAATLSFDLPQHGARRGGSTRDPEVLVFNFANPRAARDVFHQGAADLMSAVHWATGFALDAASSPTGEIVDFDDTRIVVIGHSQGATHASLAAPYEPDISALLLSGNGGDLTQSLLHKTSPVDIRSVVPIALLDPDSEGRLSTGDFHPALALFQAYFDPVDPVSYARRIQREPVAMYPAQHVFMTYGLGDSYSPEPTLQAYALAAGLVVVEPELVDFGLGEAPPPATGNIARDAMTWTIGLRQYAPEGGQDGHFVAATASAQGSADAVRFVTMALRGETPAIGE